MVLAILVLRYSLVLFLTAQTAQFFRSSQRENSVGWSPGTTLVPGSREEETGILPKAVNCWAYDRPGQCPLSHVVSQ